MGLWNFGIVTCYNYFVPSRTVDFNLVLVLRQIIIQQLIKQGAVSKVKIIEYGTLIFMTCLLPVQLSRILKLMIHF